MQRSNWSCEGDRIGEGKDGDGCVVGSEEKDPSALMGEKLAKVQLELVGQRIGAIDAPPAINGGGKVHRMR
ncbi:hypothetical protein NL676_039279 [Syzygium grande]|nr:hypothetical protein NL676_039279 [Syzygium grande]